VASSACLLPFPWAATITAKTIAASTKAKTTSAMPHHFGKAPVFLDNPATTGNTADRQNMTAVTTASRRLQRGTGRVPRSAASGIGRCWAGPVIAQRRFKKSVPRINTPIRRYCNRTSSFQHLTMPNIHELPAVESSCRRKARHVSSPLFSRLHPSTWKDIL
jgi:hypothetical protein